MASHTQLAANLLRNAATFFRDIGTNNPELKKQMEANASTYDAVADMVEQDPSGKIPLPSEQTIVSSSQPDVPKRVN
ncbi:MAG: hypothetical protein OQK24_12630 [Magnetovibrio sp.]|nr:hypothetical protein [Magnetovibrio sp.]